MSPWRLYLNVGNTRAQWGAWVGEGWALRGYCPTAVPEAWGDLLEATQASGLTREDLTSAAACLSLADPAPWLESAPAALGCPLLVLGRDFSAGVKTRYLDHAEWGPDRAAAALGAIEAGLAPCLILDAGTCLTADLLSPSGEHLGGAIAPGLPALRAGLVAQTPHLADRLPELPLPEPASDPGLTTHDNLTLGLALALEGTARALVDRWREVTQPRARVILTGGDAAFLAPRLGPGVEVRPYLALEGLRLAHQRRE